MMRNERDMSAIRYELIKSVNSPVPGGKSIHSPWMF